MNPRRRPILGFALTLLLPLVATAATGDSAGSGQSPGSPVLDGIEAEVVKVEEAVIELINNPAASFGDANIAKSSEVSLVRARLDSLLQADSTHVRANVLYARLGLASVLCTPIRFSGEDPMEQPLPASAAKLNRALDRALMREPNNAEVYYWKGALCAAPIVRAEVPTRSRTALDILGAVNAMKRAVELAPDNLTYRESLATQQLDMERPEDARETMRSAQGGQHPMYLLLNDWSHLPHPPGSRRNADARGDAQQVVARQGFPDWANARADAYVLPVRAKDIEAFYAQSFPGFKWFEVRKQEDGQTSFHFSIERLRWNGEALTASGTFEDVGLDDNVPSVVVMAGEITNPNPEARERYGVPTGKVFTVVTLMNLRKLQLAPAETPASPPMELIGTYEAQQADGRAVLEFMEGHKARISVFFPETAPRIHEGEYTTEEGQIVIRFPDNPVVEFYGKRGVLHVRAKGAKLVATLSEDAKNGVIFEFSKK